MNDYFGGQSREQVEALLRRLIEQGAEGPKVDFKKEFNLASKAEQAELVKDLSSIANTDDEAHLDDFGYIILGAERGALVGGVAELAGDIDKLQSRITDLTKGYLAPAPQFSPGGAMVTCGSCQTRQPGGKFCAECGTALAQAKKFCTGCGQELIGAAKFCANCGTAAGAQAPVSAR